MVPFIPLHLKGNNFFPNVFLIMVVSRLLSMTQIYGETLPPQWNSQVVINKIYLLNLLEDINLCRTFG